MSLSSRESERSLDNENSDAGSENLHTDSSDEETLVVNCGVNPYKTSRSQTQREPIFSLSKTQMELTATLEVGLEGRVALDEWQVIKYC
jgi:hypothetical protein